VSNNFFLLHHLQVIAIISFSVSLVRMQFGRFVQLEYKYVLSSGLNFCVLDIPSAAQACWPMLVKIHFHFASTREP